MNAQAPRREPVESTSEVPSRHRSGDAPIIVVGSGIAGLSAALAAAKGDSRHGIAPTDVLVLTSGRLEESNTLHAQGGIAAAIFPDDSPALHARDTIAAGDGLCDPRTVDILTREGAVRVRELLGHGVRFDSDSSGRPRRGLEAAHSRPRVLHAGGDATGRIVELDVCRMIRDQPRIDVLENMVVRDVIVRDGMVAGVRLWDRADGGMRDVAGSRVILATGGAGRMFPFTTNPPLATGTGVAIGLRAGAQVMDLEFYQFHPTALAMGEHFLISEAVRGEGAYLVDEHGERYMPAVDQRAELAPRDVVARENYRRIMAQNGRPVFLDATGIAAKQGLGRDRRVLAAFLADRFPTIDGYLRGHGIEWSSEPIPITPAAHYWMGGLRTDAHARTSVPGLYAAGECARTGVHGANRLASNSLLEGLVFGHRAGLAAADDPADRGWDDGHDDDARGRVLGHDNDGIGVETIDDPTHAAQVTQVAPSTTPGGATAIHADPAESLRNLMWTGVGVLRDADGLGSAREGLRRLAGTAPSDGTTPADTTMPTGDTTPAGTTPIDITLPDTALAAYACATAALARTESRGAHARTDHPRTDPLQARSRAYVLQGAPR